MMTTCACVGAVFTLDVLTDSDNAQTCGSLAVGKGVDVTLSGDTPPLAALVVDQDPGEDDNATELSGPIQAVDPAARGDATNATTNEKIAPASACLPDRMCLPRNAAEPRSWF